MKETATRKTPEGLQWTTIKGFKESRTVKAKIYLLKTNISFRQWIKMTFSSGTNISAEWPECWMTRQTCWNSRFEKGRITRYTFTQLIQPRKTHGCVINATIWKVTPEFLGFYTLLTDSVHCKTDAWIILSLT